MCLPAVPIVARKKSLSSNDIEVSTKIPCDGRSIPNFGYRVTYVLYVYAYTHIYHFEHVILLRLLRS
jgi:hypothetical protein